MIKLHDLRLSMFCWVFLSPANFSVIKLLVLLILKNDILKFICLLCRWWEKAWLWWSIWNHCKNDVPRKEMTWRVCFPPWLTTFFPRHRYIEPDRRCENTDQRVICGLEPSTTADCYRSQLAAVTKPTTRKQVRRNLVIIT